MNRSCSVGGEVRVFTSLGVFESERGKRGRGGVGEIGWDGMGWTGVLGWRAGLVGEIGFGSRACCCSIWV